MRDVELVAYGELRSELKSQNKTKQNKRKCKTCPFLLRQSLYGPKVITMEQDLCIKLKYKTSLVQQICSVLNSDWSESVDSCSIAAAVQVCI